MITELPRRIQKLYVSDAIVHESSNLLEPYRAKKVEACLLWYGYVLDEESCMVTTCVFPRQANHPTSYAIAAEYMREVRRSVKQLNLLLIMQVHTHPRTAYFSEWDAENALNKAMGALNMVVPDYGAVRWIDYARFCIVEKDEADAWRLWSGAEWERLKVVPASLKAKL
jgi:hypothetical protein